MKDKLAGISGEADTRVYTAAGNAKIAVFCYDAVSTGEQELYDVFAVDGDKMRILCIAAAVSCGRKYRYAAAIKNAACEMAIEEAYAKVVSDCQDGIEAVFEDKKYFLGNKKFIKNCGITLPYAVLRADFTGYSVIYVACETELIGFLLFWEKISNEAKNAFLFFREKGVRTVLLGHGRGIELAAKRLGADETRIAVLRIDREKVLQELKKSDKIIVVEASRDIKKCVHMFSFGSGILYLRKVNIACVAVLAVLCAAFAAVPLLSMLFAVNTAMFMLYNSLTLRRICPDMPDITEEEKMFGKVRYTMHIGGMSCAHCSARVKGTLESFRGVSAEISLEDKVAHIKCPASLDINKLSAAVTEAGYTVSAVEKV